MYKGKRIACILLNYNDAENAIKLASSIEKFDSVDDIVIVDNCSPDDSFKVIKSHEGGKISAYLSDHNGGYGYGNNYGIKIANDKSNDIAFICNTDIAFDESLLKEIVDVFISDETVAVCSAMQVNGYSNTLITNQAWRIPSYSDYITASLLFANKIFRKKRGYVLKEHKAYVDCVPGAFLGVVINKFLECGGYDERMFLYCEESVIGYRVKNKGYRTVLLTNNCYYHYHSTSIRKSIPKAIKAHKLILNSRLFYIDNYLTSDWKKHIFAKAAFSLSVVEFGLLFKLQGLKRHNN